MKLTDREIRSITVGAVDIKYENGAYHFFKYTDNQLRFFEEQSEALGNRAKTTTGIRLDFHTTSDYFAFETLTGGKYEVYIDGIFSEQRMPENGDRERCELCDLLGKKKDEYRVTLILPSHSVGTLSYLELADGATVRPHTFDRKLLFIGDSITQGWDSRFDSFSFAHRLSFFFNAESIIQGTGGAYFHENSFDTVNFDPDTVFVALGTNDFDRYATQDEMASRADAHLKLIANEYEGKQLYYISPIWRANQKNRMGSFEQARKTLIEIAKGNGFCHIDGLSLVPPHAAFYTNDLLHPNMLGYTQYTENLIRLLKK